MPGGDGRVLGRELAHHPGVGDLHAVGVNAQRVVLGQLGGEVVQRRLHGLFRHREAERVERLDLQLQPLARHDRLGGDVVEHALQLDGSVLGMGGHAVGDERAQDRDRVLHRLLDAIGRPGDRGVQRPDGALGIWRST